jgi:glycosyltransferase involved in cell wall biosynthesis
MRIGVVHWGFPPRGGGVEAHLITVYPEMVKQGAQVFVLTETMNGVPQQEIVKGIKVIRNDGMSASGLDERVKKGEDLYSSAKKLFKGFLDKYEIQAVQAHNLHMDFYDLSKALTDACREKNLPSFLIVHNHEFIDRDMGTMMRILKELPWTKFIPVSQFICSELQKNIPEIPKERFQVIVHGIDLDMFAPRSKEEKEKLKEKYGFKGDRIILHPARILRWKGIVQALKAMPAIINKFTDAKLVLTGRVSAIFKEQKEVKEYNHLVDETIEKLGVKNNVYIGSYDFSDVPYLFSISDAVIYTTIGDEPFGLCGIEAMASAVPGVVTASGGLVEGIVDNETGFIISKEEEKIPSELADRILRIFSDPSMAEKMGKAGRKRAEERFDKKRMARELIDLCSLKTKARS